jgi:hypothetical protein
MAEVLAFQSHDPGTVTSTMKNRRTRRRHIAPRHCGFTPWRRPARILQRLNEQPEGVALDQLLPDEAPDAGEPSRCAQLQRSGWAATFVGLELAKQGEVVLGQGGDFEPIHVAKT